MSLVDLSIQDYAKNLKNIKGQLTNPSSNIYNSKWTNFDSNDIGSAMLNLLSCFSHTVDYYRSYLLNNLYLPTDEPDAREQIYEMLNYKASLRRSMVLTLNFVWNESGLKSSVRIPKFFRLNLTADGITYPFLVLRRYTYRPGAVRLYVDAILGDPLDKIITLDLIVKNKVLISTQEVDSESVSFIVDGDEWTQVRNIFYETVTQNKYSVHRESDGSYIYLPSDWMDYIPSEISELRVQAAIVREPFDLNTQTPIRVCLVDELKCDLGGVVTEYFNVYVMQTRGSASVLDVGSRRIITLEDYEIEAKSYAGISDARAFNWGNGYSLGVREPNQVGLVVVGSQGAVSSFVTNGLRSYIESISLSDIEFKFIDPKVYKVDLRLYVNIGTFRNSVFESEIFQSIHNAILDYMRVDNLGIGNLPDKNALVSVIARSDSRIKFVELYRYRDIKAEPNSIISLGSLFIDFFVEANYKFDIFHISDYAGAGPLGVENITLESEYMSNLMCDLYVSDSFISSDSIVDFVRDFEDNYTFSDNSKISSDTVFYDSGITLDNGGISYEFTVEDAISSSESSTSGEYIETLYYLEGDEYTATTGGWVKGVDYGDTFFNKLSYAIRVGAYKDTFDISEVSAVTNSKVDLTSLDTVECYFDIFNLAYNDGVHYVSIIASSSKNGDLNVFDARYIEEKTAFYSPNFSNPLVLDVSGLTGTYYLRFHVKVDVSISGMNSLEMVKVIGKGIIPN